MSEEFPALAGLRAGSLMAGYRLEAQVGAGGFAVVFRARDERLGRLVALKVLSPALAADEGFRRRFIAESRAAAAVDDPHIIPVFEAGESGGVLFIAMRFVAGGDLRGVLSREGPLPPGRAAGFISPVASALDAGHRAGLVHRDVKPANILVDARADRPDHVYLSDFGVSKGAVSSVSLPGTGHYLGTPDYSAPEQIRGRAVDGRTDQYALACVAFQLLAGSVPFERDQGWAVLLAHLSEPPPPLASRRPGLPAAADQVLARAMAKAPQARYESCRDFADALREALGLPAYISPSPAAAAGVAGVPAPAATLTVDLAPRSGHASTADLSHAAPRQRAAAEAWPTKATGRRRSFRLRAAAALAAVLAVAAGLSALALSGGTGTHSALVHSSTPPGSALTLADPGGGGTQAVAFSPDGTILAVGDDTGHTYLWSLATDTVTATLADPGTSHPDAVAFSPDGTTLAVGDGAGDTYLWSLATHTITATLPDPGLGDPDAVAFSPDGTTLAVGDSDGNIYLWSLATHTIIATLTDPGSRGDVNLAFNPHGTILAADTGKRIYLWSAATRTITATLMAPGSLGVDLMAFSPDGTTLAAGGDDNSDTYLWSLATDRVTVALADPEDSTVWAVAFSPDGTALAAGDSDGNAYLWSLATDTITATFTPPLGFPVYSVAFSPEGTTLAVGHSAGNTYLWHVPGPAVPCICTAPRASGASPTATATSSPPKLCLTPCSSPG